MTPLRLLILGLLISCVGSATVSAQPAAAARKAPAPKRVSLFFGSGPGMGNLAKTTLLPNVADIEALGGKLSSRQRNLDPFGLSTFPRDDDQPVLEDETMRVTQRVTLNQALQTLKINGVNLQRKEFLIGGRNAYEGDVIELVFKSETFQAQIIEVGATQIMFRDLQRDETGVLPLSIVPHLQIEPLHNVASRFESRMAPMEPPTPSQR